MKVLDHWKKFWTFLKQDTWQSWVVSLILAFVIIKFVFFPGLSLVMGTELPLVVVESCSMYHNSDFDSWWESNAAWYEHRGITKSSFQEYGFKNGLNKGDVVLVSGNSGLRKGDIIIFEANFRFPLIHRIIKTGPFGTKGDNGFTNPNQLPQEEAIKNSQVIGKAVAKLPGLGWLKLIFFESSRNPKDRGFCK